MKRVTKITPIANFYTDGAKFPGGTLEGVSFNGGQFEVDPKNGLTKQAAKILALRAVDLTISETAAAMSVVVKTVEYHTTSAFHKLGVKTTAAAIHAAFLTGIFDLKRSVAHSEQLEGDEQAALDAIALGGELPKWIYQQPPAPEAQTVAHSLTEKLGNVSTAAGMVTMGHILGHLGPFTEAQTPPTHIAGKLAAQHTAGTAIVLSPNDLNEFVDYVSLPRCMRPVGVVGEET